MARSGQVKRKIGTESNKVKILPDFKDMSLYRLNNIGITRLLYFNPTLFQQFHMNIKHTLTRTNVHFEDAKAKVSANTSAIQAISCVFDGQKIPVTMVTCKSTLGKPVHRGYKGAKGILCVSLTFTEENSLKIIDK